MKHTPETLPFVKCERCDGGGLVALQSELIDIMKLVSFSRGITAQKAQTKLDPQGHIVPTAFNNRLRKLMRHGLMRRERHGREWVYFKSKTP